MFVTNKWSGNVKLNTFSAESGSPAHMIHSTSLLTNYQEDNGEVKIGDYNEIKSLRKGTFNGRYMNNYGGPITITLNDMLVVPDHWVNLFSITEAASNNDFKLVFDDNPIAIHTNNKA
jgi:hypothetical protein